MARTLSAVVYIAVSALLLVATLSAVSQSIGSSPLISSGLLSRIMYGDQAQLEGQEYGLASTEYTSRKLLAIQHPVGRRPARRLGMRGRAAVRLRSRDRFSDYFQARALSESSSGKGEGRQTGYLRINSHETE